MLIKHSSPNGVHISSSVYLNYKSNKVLQYMEKCKSLLLEIITKSRSPVDVTLSGQCHGDLYETMSTAKAPPPRAVPYLKNMRPDHFRSPFNYVTPSHLIIKIKLPHMARQTRKYSRLKDFFQEVKFIYNIYKMYSIFLKYIQDIYLLFKVFKIHSRVTVLDMKKNLYVQNSI